MILLLTKRWIYNEKANVFTFLVDFLELLGQFSHLEIIILRGKLDYCQLGVFTFRIINKTKNGVDADSLQFSYIANIYCYTVICKCVSIFAIWRAWLIVVKRKMSNFSAISWREQATFWWDDDVRVLID